MAVLHHAFRYRDTPDSMQALADLKEGWLRGDLDKVSAKALAAHASIAGRPDLHAAFMLGPESPVMSWLQPEDVTLELAAFVILAPHFLALPNLSAYHETGHHLLEMQLPALGWSMDDVAGLVRGHPLGTMLRERGYVISSGSAGGFGDTGGWTAGAAVIRLKALVEQTIRVADKQEGHASYPAVSLSNTQDALRDAKAMLSSVSEEDWLVTAVTH